MTTKKPISRTPKTVPKKSTEKGRKKAPVHTQSDYRIRFFVADDIRTDNDGKPMLIGFYSDNTVGLKVPPAVAPTTTEPLGLNSLTFMFTISAPPGEHIASLTLELKNSMVHTKVSENKFQTTLDKPSYNIIAKAQPFPVFSFGVQNVKINIDGFEFTETFELRRFDTA